MLYLTRDEGEGGAVKVWYGMPTKIDGRWYASKERTYLLRTFGLEETQFPDRAKRKSLLKNYKVQPGGIVKLRGGGR